MIIDKIISIAVVICGLHCVSAQDLVTSVSGATAGLKHRDLTEEEYRMEVIDHLIRSGLFLPSKSPLLNRMGDEVGINLIKILGSGTVWDDLQKKVVLEIIHRSFEFPNAISKRSDLVPNATLVLLSILERNSETQEIKDQLTSTREYASTASGRYVPRQRLIR